MSEATLDNSNHMMRAKNARIAGWKDYFALLKPRVMSLVVFTALVGFVCAKGDTNPIMAALSIFAIAMGGGAAGALNMW